MATNIIIRCLDLLFTNIVFIKYIYTFCYDFNINICHLCYFNTASFNIIFCTCIIYTCTYYSCNFWISVYTFIFLYPFIIFKCIDNNRFGNISLTAYVLNFVINCYKFFILIRCNIFLLVLNYQLCIFFSVNI